MHWRALWGVVLGGPGWALKSSPCSHHLAGTCTPCKHVGTNFQARPLRWDLDNVSLLRRCTACHAGLDSPPLPYLQALPYGGGPLRCLVLRRMYRLGPRHTQELGRLTALTQLQLAADWWVVVDSRGGSWGTCGEKASDGTGWWVVCPQYLQGFSLHLRHAADWWVVVRLSAQPQRRAALHQVQRTGGFRFLRVDV